MFNALKSDFNKEEKDLNDEDSFRELYVLCASYCLKNLSRCTDNTQEAEDVFSEAISLFWLRSKQGKIKSTQNIPAYVFTIARNMLFTNRKKRLKTEDLATIHPNMLKMDDIRLQKSESSELTEKLNRSLKELSGACRQLLLYKYVYKYTYEEMAERLNRKSSDSLKTQTFRCLKKLKERMKKQ